MQITKNGQIIKTLDDWWSLAPPKDPVKQWVDGRSAKETARAWTEREASPPPEILNLLRSHPDLAATELRSVEPEVPLRFDKHRSPRCADLAGVASCGTAPVAVTVEAKADEPFDNLVSKVLEVAFETLIEKPRSGAVSRVLQLAQALFRERRGLGPTVGELRYQLLTGTAGTLAHARSSGAKAAVFVVHEFVTSLTARRNLDRNQTDLDAFVHRLSGGRVTSVASGKLVGPFRVPGAPLFESPADLYIGKAVRRVAGQRSERR